MMRVLLIVLVLVFVAVLPAGAAAEIVGGGADETASQAYGPLQGGMTYSGAFASQSDVDYLSFVVTSAGETLQFTVANTTQVCQDPNDAGCPVYATIMDSTGQNQVGGSDSDAGTIATYGDTESFGWTFAQPGTYYLLMESDGDLTPGSPSYSVELGGGSGGGAGGAGGGAGGSGGGGGSSGGSGPPGGGGRAVAPLVRSLKVSPRQRGKAVRATVILGKRAVWLRTSLMLMSGRRKPAVVARRIYRNLAPGTHRLVVRLPAALARELAHGRRLLLRLRVVVAGPSGALRSYTRAVTLRR